MKTFVRNAKAPRLMTKGLSENQNQIVAGGKNKRFDFSNYRQSARFGQLKCKKCLSDYMRFAVNGFCQDCQQKVEFIVREFPHLARKQEAMTR